MADIYEGEQMVGSIAVGSRGTLLSLIGKEMEILQARRSCSIMVSDMATYSSSSTNIFSANYGSKLRPSPSAKYSADQSSYPSTKYSPSVSALYDHGPPLPAAFDYGSPARSTYNGMAASCSDIAVSNSLWSDLKSLLRSPSNHSSCSRSAAAARLSALTAAAGDHSHRRRHRYHMNSALFLDTDNEDDKEPFLSLLAKTSGALPRQRAEHRERPNPSTTSTCPKEKVSRLQDHEKRKQLSCSFISKGSLYTATSSAASSGESRSLYTAASSFSSKCSPTKYNVNHQARKGKVCVKASSAGSDRSSSRSGSSHMKELGSSYTEQITRESNTLLHSDEYSYCTGRCFCARCCMQEEDQDQKEQDDDGFLPASAALYSSDKNHLLLQHRQQRRPPLAQHHPAEEPFTPPSTPIISGRPRSLPPAALLFKGGCRHHGHDVASSSVSVVDLQCCTRSSTAPSTSSGHRLFSIVSCTTKRLSFTRFSHS